MSITHHHSNKHILDKIGQDTETSNPLWNGGEWPGSGGGVTTDYVDGVSDVIVVGNENVVITPEQFAANKNFRIDLSAWSTNRVIEVPTVKREFGIFTIGTYTATVKTAAGTGIPVAAGTSRPLVCDGVNVVDPLSAYYTADVNKLVKLDKQSPCIVKIVGGAASIKAGTVFNGVAFATDTAITMPILTAGEDYSVWVHPDGTASAVADPYSAPATAPVAGAKKIGGFHYGLVEPRTTVADGSFSTGGFTNTGGSMSWTQADVEKIAGINEFSLWDLLWRCKGEQRGMTLDPQTLCWHGIYFLSTDHITNGPSRYNTDVASGTVLPKIPLVYGGDGTTTYGRLSLYEAVEIAASHNCRLPSYEEFMSAAFGVTEGQSLGGASSTIPATARQPGYTSRIGMEQATGHHYIIGAPFGSTGGSAWSGTGRGSLYGTSGMPLFGGARDVAANSGSRCSTWNDVAWYSYWTVGMRAAGDHLIGE